MIIPAGTILHYQKYSPLEILSQEPYLKFWIKPISLSVVKGMYFPHHHQQPHLYHFESGRDAIHWLKDQDIELGERAMEHPEVFAFADVLVSLVEAANKKAGKAAIRNIAYATVPFGSQTPPEFISYVILHAALYK